MYFFELIKKARMEKKVPYATNNMRRQSKGAGGDALVKKTASRFPCCISQKTANGCGI